MDCLSSEDLKGRRLNSLCLTHYAESQHCQVGNVLGRARRWLVCDLSRLPYLAAGAPKELGRFRFKDGPWRLWCPRAISTVANPRDAGRLQISCAFSVLPTRVPSAAGCVPFVIAKGKTDSQGGVVWAGLLRKRTAAYEQTLPHLKCKKHRDTPNSDSKQKCRTSLFGL